MKIFYSGLHPWRMYAIRIGKRYSILDYILGGCMLSVLVKDILFESKA